VNTGTHFVNASVSEVDSFILMGRQAVLTKKKKLLGKQKAMTKNKIRCFVEEVFWVVISCQLVNSKHFGGVWYLHIHCPLKFNCYEQPWHNILENYLHQHQC
jgi:hypothetical protein